MTIADGTQYLRKSSLTVLGPVDRDRLGQTGLDLSAFRFEFYIKAPDTMTPPLAFIRVYNLAEKTAEQIKGEFTRVVVNAGYEYANYGVIFSGTIKQVRTGRIDAITSYVDIYAADGDEAYTQAFVNQTLAPDNSAQKDQLAAINKVTSQFGVTLNPNQSGAATAGGILPRGKVLYGMARDLLRRNSQTNGTSWQVVNGQIIITPLTGYQPGEVVVLTAKTGLVGVPEITDQGLMCRCLLNPKLQVGNLIQLDNKGINNVTVKEQGFPDYTSINFFASEQADGYYRVIVVEHSGDSRGDSWFSTLTCLAADLSAGSNAVQAYGPAQRNGS